MTPADELRATAKLLREDAHRARITSPLPWTTTDEHVIRCGNEDIVADRSSSPSEAGDLPYIAAMHPGVGLAVADWLESTADLHEPKTCEKHDGCDPLGCQRCGDEDWPCADTQRALATARSLNSGQP